MSFETYFPRFAGAFSSPVRLGSVSFEIDTRGLREAFSSQSCTLSSVPLRFTSEVCGGLLKSAQCSLGTYFRGLRGPSQVLYAELRFPLRFTPKVCGGLLKPFLYAGLSVLWGLTSEVCGGLLKSCTALSSGSFETDFPGLQGPSQVLCGWAQCPLRLTSEICGGLLKSCTALSSLSFGDLHPRFAGGLLKSAQCSLGTYFRGLRGAFSSPVLR